MSVEVGSKSKTIKYLNIHKEGVSNDDYIMVDERWPSAFLQHQDDYLVALSRFEVPLNRVPVTAEMKNCIQVYAYNHLYDDIKTAEDEDALHGIGKLTTANAADQNIFDTPNPETSGASASTLEQYFTACETHENGRLCLTETSQNDGTVVSFSGAETDMIVFR